MYGIAIDLYESIMYIYMQLITSDEYINIYILENFFQIDLYHFNNNGKTTVLLYISLFFFNSITFSLF